MIGNTTFSVRSYRKFNQAGRFPLIVERKKNFDGLTKFARKVSFDVLGVPAGKRRPESLAHALPRVTIRFSRGSYWHGIWSA